LPENEIVELIDADDKAIGDAALGECLSGGLLHRAVAVLVVRGNGDYVMQARSRRDRWHPELSTISATGHVRKGEGCHAASQRELQEELGLGGELSAVKKYHLPPFTEGNLTEYEIVYLFKCYSDEPCKIDPTELDGIREVTETELRRSVAEGQLTPDARMILTDLLEKQ
jgi:isopentenyldiphosphate isomerase